MGVQALYEQKKKNSYFKKFSEAQIYQYVTLLMNLRKAIHSTPIASSVELYYLTTDHYKIFYQYWLPKESIQKILLMCHGFQCHSDLYYVLADYFLDKNTLIAAWDQRGHGRSDGPHGHLESFELIYQDLLQFIQLLKKEYPGIPIYLQGESMGALVALNFATRFPEELAGVITLAPGIRPKLPLFKILMPLLPIFYPFKFLFNKKPIIKVPSDFDNPTYEDAFNKYDMNDILHLNPVSLGMLYNLLKLIITSLSIVKKEISIPILICQGTGDKALDYHGAIELYNKVSISDKTIHLYRNANHSLLMDRNAKKIYSDIYSWLKSH